MDNQILKNPRADLYRSFSFLKNLASVLVSLMTFICFNSSVLRIPLIPRSTYICCRDGILTEADPTLVASVEDAGLADRDPKLDPGEGEAELETIPPACV